MISRFFVAESDLWQSRADHLLEQIKEQNAINHEFQHKHGADALYMLGKRIAGLCWIEGSTRKGWLVANLLPLAGDNYHACKPDKRTTIGKAVAAELAVLNKATINFSDVMVRYLPKGFQHWRAVGHAMFYPVSGYVKKQLVFKIPCSGDCGMDRDVDTLSLPVPEGLKEIKESEFIAITKE